MRAVCLLLFVTGCVVPAVDSGPSGGGEDRASVTSIDRRDRVGVYNWGADAAALFPGRPFDGPNELIAQLGTRTIRVALSMRGEYGGPHAASLAEAARGMAGLFADPRFATYLLTTYSDDDGLALWQDGYSADERGRERAAFAELAAYLSGAFPTKRFILLNWEGDNQIASLRACDASWIGFRDWIQARADGVRDAAAANVFSGLEFNLVRTRDGAPCDRGANRCVVSAVAPDVTVDYYSYSSYQSIGYGVAVDAIGATLRRDLDTARGWVVAPPERFIVGELGFAREVPEDGECVVARRLEATLRAALDWGVAHAIYWQVLDNVADGSWDGFGLYKQDGALGLAGRTLSEFLVSGALAAATAPSCPQIAAGGVVEASAGVATSSSILSIYGSGFAGGGRDVVHVHQGRWHQTVASGSPWFYSDPHQINFALPAGLAGGSDEAVIVYVTSDGVDSNGQWVRLAAPGTRCGDGRVDAGEACDGGPCCTEACTLRPAGTTCRDTGLACDAAEACDGATAACPADQLVCPSSCG